MAENNSSTPLKTAEGSICERCAGSGEDPEGFMTHGYGPNDYTVDGPCRQCGGTGEPTVITRNYSDGTAATGVGPLPNLSPNQQQVKTALSGLDAVEAMLGGANGPTIQIRTVLERAQAVAAQAAPAEGVPCGVCGADDAFTGSCGGGRSNPRAHCFERAALAATPALPATEDSSAGDQVEVHPDDAAVDALAAKMKAKLAKQRAKGYGGWDTPECSQLRLSAMLRDHVDKGDPVDVANFCAFLDARGEGIEAEVQAEPVALQMCSELKPRTESEKAAYLAGVADGRMYAERDADTAPQAQPAPVQAEPVAFTAAQRERLYRNKPKNTGSGLSLADWHRVVKFIESAQSHKQTVIQAQPGAMELWEALCDSRATLHAISQTLDDHELRGAAKEAYEKASTLTCPSTAPQAQPADALDAAVVALEFNEWIKHEYPHLGPIGDGVNIAHEAWNAGRAAMAAAQEGGNAATGKDGAA